jgi:predicted RNA-binding protein YlxR (DUF448 family)
MLPTTSTTMPLRTCVGCRSKRPQSEMVRCTLAADGTPVISRTAAGRGAWLCTDQAGCLNQAIKRRGLDRAWKRPVGATEHNILTIAYEAMTKNMEN